MRFLFTTRGSRGDVLPLLAAADKLVRRGHSVTLATWRQFRTPAERLGLDFVALDAPVLPADAGPVAPRDSEEEWAAQHRLAFEAELEQLTPLARDADVVVVGLVSHAGPTAAEAAGVPCRFVTYSPFSFPSTEHPPSAHFSPQLGDEENWRLWAEERAATAKLLDVMRPHRSMLGLPALSDPWRHFLDYDGRPILAADPLLGPMPKDAPRGALQVGAALPELGSDLSARTAAFLDAGEAPVLISFGIMPHTDARSLEVLEAVRRIGRRTIISNRFADTAPEGCLLVGPEPYSRLFPRCAAVVHHGGAGTMTTAARAGIPQLVVWHLGDQGYWGERVRMLGIGPPPIDAGHLDAAGLAAAIIEATECPEYRRNAADLMSRLAEDDGGRRLAEALLDTGT